MITISVRGVNESRVNRTSDNAIDSFDQNFVFTICIGHMRQPHFMAGPAFQHEPRRLNVHTWRNPRI